jgi:hypothetical protein
LARTLLSNVRTEMQFKLEMGRKQEAWTPEALSSTTYTIGRHLDNIEMPQLGPIDAFINDIWDHGHIDVASTQHNATLLVPVTGCSSRDVHE